MSLLLCLLSTAVPLPGQILVDPELVAEAVLTPGSVQIPVNMEFIGPDDLLVGEKNTGLVKRVLAGVTLTTPVLDLAVANVVEAGLLGMALHPEFFTGTPLVYLYYTVPEGDVDGGLPIANRISRFTWDGSELSGEEIVITLPGFRHHNGGYILFGPPGVAPAEQKLFAVIGDQVRDNQNQNYINGAPPDDTGMILRLNADGSAPDDGPFFAAADGNSSLEHMYAYGIRNSFGLCFDPLTDVLWMTENGPDEYDEINRVDPAFNSGWEDVMGPRGAPLSDHPASSTIQLNGVGAYSDPEFSWFDPVAPTAIIFFNSSGLGQADRNDCFVGDNNNGKIYRFELNAARDELQLSGELEDKILQPGESDAPVLFASDIPGITDFDIGFDGALYVICRGRFQIYRIYRPQPPPVNTSAIIVK